MGASVRPKENTETAKATANCSTFKSGFVMKELHALQNAANDLGLVIVEKHEQDKRKMKRYYALKNGACVSPVLDYDQLNHFLLGWRQAINYTL